ncbi:BTB/POZ domain-containing protein At3g19850 [Amborella trichopoda]|uniref:NPH3 domain-containing protein n=1 Tax=Amborella trichopoda TaxID=13333 RepID=W1PNU2_AMBTC|nr:BTB/POZ domain-containing protein At3g19850 [Amborella trichopoda]ERN09484.1 hypothetical protein AMTR_s00029p00109650 [Amborella trichopoda]|eukprot:XP_020525112.1 BTB/POZ domain-containing protein At3g19850 [Amborella trichopoda]
MPEPCDLQVLVNGHSTFFVNKRIISSYSGRFRKLLNQERETLTLNPIIKINDIPGGAHGFELASRFCYNNGKIHISTKNVALLFCISIAMEMNSKLSSFNLLNQTQTFLQGLFYWTFNDTLAALKQCESFVSVADSSGLLDKLIDSLLNRIAVNSDGMFPHHYGKPLSSSSSSSASSSPDISGFRFSPDVTKRGSRPWWFDDLTALSPVIIQRLSVTMRRNGVDSLLLSRFLLHYLRYAVLTRGSSGSIEGYSGISEIAVSGVVLRKSGFSCRGLFGVLRVVSGFEGNKDCRQKVEELIGSMLDQATLDDILVSGFVKPSGFNKSGIGKSGGFYDVSLVLRLVRVFLGSNGEGSDMDRVKRVGRLVDKYLVQIAPDPSLKVSKFVALVVSLPDYARDSHDGVYAAIDMYLQAHQGLSSEDRAKLCKSLNFEKLSHGACRHLAHNPNFPPRLAIQALVSRQSSPQLHRKTQSSPCSPLNRPQKKEEVKASVDRMKRRVVELEKACREMQSQMPKLSRNTKLTSPLTNTMLFSKLCL